VVFSVFLLHNCHGKIKQQNSINQQRAWTTPTIKKSCSLERLGNSHLTFGEGGMFFFLNRTWPAFYISGLFVYILNDLHMGSLSY